MFKITEPRNATVSAVTETKTGKIRATIITFAKIHDEFVPSYWDAFFAPSMQDLARALKPKTKIVIKNASISNKEYLDKEGNKRKSVDLCIWDFELSAVKHKPDENSNPFVSFTVAEEFPF